MAQTTANGIQIEYETFGNPAGSPMLLINGLGSQLLSWDAEFCELLAERGFFAIRFDNRDVGLSTRFDDRPIADVPAVLKALRAGERVDVPYTLSDMAADAAGVLEALEVAAAHIVGVSMGGMIAQTFAIEHQARALSLTSIMSTTGNPAIQLSTPEANAALMTPSPTEREAYIEHTVANSRVIGSKGELFDEARVRARAAAAYDRAFYPEGVGRQLVAINASGSRKERLASVLVPTLVLHGDIDPLVRLEGGIDTADAIPGAELVIIEGMGHDLPRPLWPRIIDAIASNAAKAGAPAK
ncbi:MAG: alpha/beta fold hydrolase [Dehalococcoidia bacterium]|nr:alpha/beta fold hydrolase [Dehalococcoidia bacterium]